MSKYIDNISNNNLYSRRASSHLVDETTKLAREAVVVVRGLKGCKRNEHPNKTTQKKSSLGSSFGFRD